MNILREIQFETEPIVLCETKTKDGTVMDILVPWCQSDVKNGNGRNYSRALLDREVERIQSSVKEGSFLGTGDHPKTGVANIATASHIVKKVWLDKKGKGWTELTIVPTSRGKDVMTLINNGAKLGVSARGTGNVDETTGMVQDDYKFMGIDIVTSPSFGDGAFNKNDIFESLEFEPEDKLKENLSLKINTISEEKMNLVACPADRRRKGCCSEGRI